MLKHPNIRPILGVFLDSNAIPLVILPYARRGSAAEWLGQQEHRTPAALWKIVRPHSETVMVYL